MFPLRSSARRRLATVLFAISASVSLPAQHRPKRAVLEGALGKLETNLSYGPNRRNVLDLYRPKSDKRTPVVVFFHGGGFRSGDKSVLLYWFTPLITELLRHGVSVVSANYRFLAAVELEGVLADCARVVQFLRHDAAKLGLDPARIAAFGVSAGAGISLWLATRDDRADATSKDPIARESTRICAAGVLSGQCTYDLRRWNDLVGPPPPLIARYFKGQVARLGRRCGGLDTPEARAIIKEVDLLGWLSKDDPPLFLFASWRRRKVPAKTYDQYMHHPRHALVLRDRCKQLGVACELLLDADHPTEASPGVQRRLIDFLLRRLKPKVPYDR